MKGILFIIAVIILLFPIDSFANPEKVGLGDSKEKLIEIQGKATEIKELSIKDKKFITYFYEGTNTFYVIDTDRNIICSIGLGRTKENYCYPCDYGPTADTCP